MGKQAGRPNRHKKAFCKWAYVRAFESIKKYKCFLPTPCVSREKFCKRLISVCAERANKICKFNHFNGFENEITPQRKLSEIFIIVGFYALNIAPLLCVSVMMITQITERIDNSR